MRSTTRSRAVRGSSAVEDLTTRARIRDAAIAQFGVEGFSASVRSIATQAGVSPGLVIHHFGSKDGLRAACDEHALRVVRDDTTEAICSSTADLFDRLAAAEEHAPLLAYVAQTLLAGGTLAVTFLEHMVTTAEIYLEAAVAAGTIRPSNDPRARARYLVMASVGALLLHLRLYPPVDGSFGTALRSVADVTVLPVLELYTEGLLTSRNMLDSYLRYVSDPPAGADDHHRAGA